MKIVIVGGGTAGWLAALMISKVHPYHELTMIESSKIGIIGAGEGSTGYLTSIISGKIYDFGCNLMEFLKDTGATLKYGIKHKGWTPDITKSYFGPLGGTPSDSDSIHDYYFSYVNATDPNKLHLSSSLGYKAEHNLSDFSLKTFDFSGHDFALHFDAHAVGKYFKKVTTKSKQVEQIDNVVQDIVLNEQGFVDKLILEDNTEVSGDFFIDASGFSRVIMNKLNNKWVSYKENLPVNTAMPFILKHEQEKIEPWTTAWAQSSGWMWQIPTQDRIGCGYVYCDEFITADEAHKEIETILGKQIEPIRTLKFDTGRLDKAWVKNCLAIGLSSAFAEPLEATSIPTTLVQLWQFIFDNLEDNLEKTVADYKINCYNRQTAQLYDELKDFLNIHYMGGRSDSKFWRYINTGATQTDFVKEIINICKHKQPNSRYMKNYFGSAGWGLWCYILAGTGHITPLHSKLEIEKFSKFKNMNDIQKDIQSMHIEFSEYNKLNQNLTYDKFISYLKRQRNDTTV